MDTTASPDLSKITVTPGQRSGQPCIRGLRVTGWDALDMLTRFFRLVAHTVSRCCCFTPCPRRCTRLRVYSSNMEN